MPEQPRYRMAGEGLGLEPAQVVDPPAETPENPKPRPERDPDLRAAVVCPIPGLPADRCCKQFPCRRLPPGSKQPLPGLDVGLA
jgi:hypothetical protein